MVNRAQRGKSSRKGVDIVYEPASRSAHMNGEADRVVNADRLPFHTNMCRTKEISPEQDCNRGSAKREVCWSLRSTPVVGAQHLAPLNLHSSTTSSHS